MLHQGCLVFTQTLMAEIKQCWKLSRLHVGRSAALCIRHPRVDLGNCEVHWACPMRPWSMATLWYFLVGPFLKKPKMAARCGCSGSDLSRAIPKAIIENCSYDPWWKTLSYPLILVRSWSRLHTPRAAAEVRINVCGQMSAWAIPLVKTYSHYQWSRSDAGVKVREDKWPVSNMYSVAWKRFDWDGENFKPWP